jgi:hypothetical protein
MIFSVRKAEIFKQIIVIEGIYTDSGYPSILKERLRIYWTGQMN